MNPGWIDWQAWRESQSGSSAPKVTTLDAYSSQADPDGIICRPCQDTHHEECEGSAAKCRCQLCFELKGFIRQLEDDWDFDDKVRSWPK